MLSEQKNAKKNLGIPLIQLMKHGLEKNKIGSIVGNNLISKKQR